MPALRDFRLVHAREVDGLAEEHLARVGPVLPVITSIIVVLPAPFGPMMQRSSPASIDSVSLFSARKPSKLTVMSSRYRIVPCERVDLAGRDDVAACRRRRRLRARSIACSSCSWLGAVAHVRLLLRIASISISPMMPLRQEQRHQHENQRRGRTASIRRSAR